VILSDFISLNQLIAEQQWCSTPMQKTTAFGSTDLFNFFCIFELCCCFT